MPVYCTGTFPLRQNLSNPPYGERGVGASVARAARWGRIENYMAQVNDSLCLLVQVESKTALDNLDEILDVEGIDGVFIGPADLSASLGYPDNAGHPEVQRIIETSIRRIRAAGKAAGFLAVAMAGPPALLPGLMGGYLAWLGMTPTSPDGWVSSSFWGALLAGAFAGYTIRGLRRLFAKLPTGLEALKTTLIYPVVGLIVVGLLMVVVVNPPLGQFNNWLYRGLESMQGGSRIALGAVLGAMMAVDFGGPVNKAAYLFGTVTLSGGQQGFMAAVMLGGMVPPLAVALACTLFPSRFSRAERNAAPMNYLMGFSFITEGALPFALRDPLRVIPSCMAGSALAGGLSTALHCGVPAPHGGLYVLPLANNVLGMLLALVAGSVVSAVLMGLLKQAAPAESAPAPDLNPEANP